MKRISDMIDVVRWKVSWYEQIMIDIVTLL